MRYFEEGYFSVKILQIQYKQLFLIVISILNLYSISFAEAGLTLLDLNDKKVSVSDYKGKWVIVNYWATWCPPCAAEIPELNAFHKKYHTTDAVVLGVNIEIEDLEYVKEFVKDFKIIYPILKAKDSVSSPYGHLQALPTTFIIDTKGKLRKTIVGAVTFERLENIIKSKAVTD